MNIQELQSERDALQRKLREYIHKELFAFQEKTGVSVDSVYVDMVSYQQLLFEKPKYYVSNVKVGLDL